jgi:hypothetical protein
MGWEGAQQLGSNGPSQLLSSCSMISRGVRTSLPSIEAANSIQRCGGMVMRFANSVTIQRSPQDVFKFLAAFENVPKWTYAIVETRKTNGRARRSGNDVSRSSVASRRNRGIVPSYRIRSGPASRRPW